MGRVDADVQKAMAQMILAERVLGYDILRRAFLETPNREFIEMLKKENLLAPFPLAADGSKLLVAGDKLGNYLSQKASGGDRWLEELKKDYDYLFIGPHRLPAPPWESAYGSGGEMLFQESTLEVRRWYLKYELLPKGHPHEADDHLGLELDFMYQLSGLTLDHSQKETVSDSEELLTDQKNFLETHLLNWVPKFAADLANHAKTDYFQMLADILKAYIETDRQVLVELMDGIKGHQVEGKGICGHKPIN